MMIYYRANMMFPDILRDVPEHLLTLGRFTPFPDYLSAYPPLMRINVNRDVSNVPIDRARKMPIDSASIFTVGAEGRKFQIQLAKAESIPFVVALRFTSKKDTRYKLEADIYRMSLLLADNCSAAFRDNLNPNSV